MTLPSTPYPATYYQTVTELPDDARAPVTGNMSVDICIIGGGLSGLSTALSLSEQGRTSIVVEKHRVAWGASGRNAGMVLSGFDAGMDFVLKKQGPVPARQMYGLTLNAINLIKNRIREYGISCGTLPEGNAVVSCTETGNDLKAEVERHNQIFGSNWEHWNTEKTRQHFHSDHLFGSIFMPEALHIQPLAYTLGLADEVERQGSQIFEGTDIISLKKTARGYLLLTDRGHHIKAKTVVCAGSGYLTGELPFRIKNAVMPIETYIGVTAPLTESQRQASITCSYGAYDNRNVMNYFRLLPDNRLLWGGGHESVSFFGPKKNLDAAMRKDLVSFFPALQDVAIDYIWSGMQGYSRHRMPQIQEVTPGLWVNMGHGGQGITTTTLCGDLIAKALVHGDPTYKLFRPYGLDFTGGPLGKPVAAILAWWMKRQDSRQMDKSS